MKDEGGRMNSRRRVNSTVRRLLNMIYKNDASSIEPHLDLWNFPPSLRE
jgi:hypothetical protein